jgi:hypothetical protein
LNTLLPKLILINNAKKNCSFFLLPQGYKFGRAHTIIFFIIWHPSYPLSICHYSWSNTSSTRESFQVCLQKLWKSHQWVPKLRPPCHLLQVLETNHFLGTFEHTPLPCFSSNHNPCSKACPREHIVSLVNLNSYFKQLGFLQNPS